MILIWPLKSSKAATFKNKYKPFVNTDNFYIYGYVCVCVYHIVYNNMYGMEISSVDV